MSPSRVEMETGGVDFDHDHKDVEEEEEEIKKIESYKGLGRRSTVKDPTDADLEQLRRQSSEDDPNAFIMQMKKDIHLQRHIRRLLLLAHKKALAEWGTSPARFLLLCATLRCVSGVGLRFHSCYSVLHYGV